MYAQSMVVQPRNSASRIAKMDESQRTIGSDGKLYRLVDNKDAYKYKVMSEDDMMLEARRSQELVKTITAGRKNTSANRIAPKRATQGLNKSQRIENRRYNEQLVSNDQASRGENAHPNMTMSITGTGALRPSVSQQLPPPPAAGGAVPEALLHSLTVLQSKYEKNLEVIDILFDEKKKMEQKVALLESKMVENTNKFEVGIGSKTREECEEELVRASGGLHAPKPSEEAVTPSMAAALFGNEEDRAARTAPAPRTVRPQSAGRARSAVAPRGRMGASTGSASVLRRSQDDSAVSSSQTVRKRSISVDSSRKSVGAFSQSIQMQASIDRYMQRKSLVEQKEKAALLDQKAYEQAQRERYLRASRNGKEFKEMTQRCAQGEQKRAEKLAAHRRKLQEMEDKAVEARRKKVLDHLNKPIPKHELTWKEVEEQNALKIKERKERFKQELLMSVNKQAGVTNATTDTIKEKIMLLQKEAEEKDAAARKFVAKDPQKVAAQLEQAKRLYDAAQEKKAEKQQMMRENRKQIMATIHNTPALLSMEERARKQQEKAEKKAKDAAEKEAEAARKAKELEQRRMQSILKAKVPEASMRSTKSATYRTIKVKENVEKEAAEAQRLERERARKLAQEKELAAILRADIAERELERKSKVTGYVELQGTEEKAAAIAQIARQQYRENLRANRMKIADKLKERPSLIARHEQDLRKKAASSAALQAVSNTVGPGKEEIFNNEEKMRLGLDDDDDSMGI